MGSALILGLKFGLYDFSEIMHPFRLEIVSLTIGTFVNKHRREM